ncbi:hypothetical protein ACQ4PT_041579 [Festuca glaucescens]
MPFVGRHKESMLWALKNSTWSDLESKFVSCVKGIPHEAGDEVAKEWIIRAVWELPKKKMLHQYKKRKTEIAESIYLHKDGKGQRMLAKGKDVHETAAGALWNLAFYSRNALRIVEESLQSQEVDMRSTMRAFCRKQEQLGSCVQRRQQHQLRLRPKCSPELSLGIRNTINQGHQPESTMASSASAANPPTRYRF